MAIPFATLLAGTATVFAGVLLSTRAAWRSQGAWNGRSEASALDLLMAFGLSLAEIAAVLILSFRVGRSSAYLILLLIVVLWVVFPDPSSRTFSSTQNLRYRLKRFDLRLYPRMIAFVVFAFLSIAVVPSFSNLTALFIALLSVAVAIALWGATKMHMDLAALPPSPIEIGTELPMSIASVLDDAEIAHVATPGPRVVPTFLMFLRSDCGPCRKVVALLSQRTSEPFMPIVIITDHYPVDDGIDPAILVPHSAVTRLAEELGCPGMPCGVVIGPDNIALAQPIVGGEPVREFLLKQRTSVA